MSWLIDLVLGPAMPYLLAAVGVAGAFLMGKSKGSNTERRKQAEKRAETAQEAREIDDEVNKAGDADVRADLSGWMRDADE